MGKGYLFTSESVAEGHPDKVADQVSDAILDACLAQDPHSRVACETLITKGLIVLAGEITTRAHVDYEAIARKTIREIGYGAPDSGFDLEHASVIVKIHEQSPDIALGVDLIGGAGDQGLMFGYATDETPEYMPLPLQLAQKLVQELKGARPRLPFLRPDGKTQVTIEYDEKGRPQRVHTVVLSVQHDESVDNGALRGEMERFIRETIEVDRDTLLHINPTGRFVIGGPDGDTGLTGRKIIVDSYGGTAHHGGGAFSGKDPTKVDRSGAYLARYIAKNLVAAGLTPACEVQLAYAIGVAEPISLRVDTFGKTGDLVKYVRDHFPLTPEGIIKKLDLRRPIYQRTAFGGHFGRSEFPWEKTTPLP